MLQLKNMKLNERQKIIIEFAKNKKDFQTKDILDFVFEKFPVERITITRDLSFLVSNNILKQEWKWRSVKYFLSEDCKIFEEIDVENYFQLSYEKRDVQESFNFEIFKILENDIFTKEETEKLENLQIEFIKNISSYDSQTLINKEYERIMIEFSWKSSAIEWNTYSLLNTEALIKDNIKDNTKTNEETQMILNHKDAFNESIQNKEDFLDLRISSLSYIHSVLIKKLDVITNIRKHPVWITGTKYKPLDNEFQIKEVLESLLKLINKKESFFEKAFLALILLS